MSEETTAGAEIHDLVEAGRKKLDARASDRFQMATDYVRANPWVAVGIAAAVGGLIAVAAKRPKTRAQNLDAFRDWLDEAYSKIPSEKQVRSVVDSSGAPSFLRELGKKLRLS